MNFQSQIQQMARAISMSPEFIRFYRARNRILAVPSISSRVLAMEQSMQGIMKSAYPDAPRQIELLKRNNQDLLQRPEVNEFIESSQALNQTISNTVAQLYQSLDSYLGG